MIEVEQITRLYGDRAAVEDLSFKVRKGTVHGFLGPNGAGKTTTMKMIAALIPPHSGRILIDGEDVSQNSKEIKKKIGILLETPPLFLDMELRDYLIYAAKLRMVEKDRVKSLVDDTIEKLALGDVQNRILGNLSKGYKQKAGVAQAIVHDPEIVILDEPTSGLDPKAVIEMRSLIKDLKENHTVLFSSHLLKEADLICDDVTIISHGKLMASASREEIGKSLSEKTVVEMLVRVTKEGTLDLIRDLSFTQNLIVEPEGDNQRIKVYADTLQDYREELSKIVVDADLGLLELNQERPDLEKIFLEVTKGDKS